MTYGARIDGEFRVDAQGISVNSQAPVDWIYIDLIVYRVSAFPGHLGRNGTLTFNRGIFGAGNKEGQENSLPLITNPSSVHSTFSVTARAQELTTCAFSGIAKSLCSGVR